MLVGAYSGNDETGEECGEVHAGVWEDDQLEGDKVDHWGGEV